MNLEVSGLLNNLAIYLSLLAGNKNPEVNELLDKVKEFNRTIYLEESFWQQIKNAAMEGDYPPEYCMNDWVGDVLEFLKNRDNYIRKDLQE